ncbi:hypothetical protein QBC38DRAFT_540266 [Podospora fimiseda]|uniref:EthD domain-containing protein n=1 Tax=Podospora fimiseda TaxID=252190 RepID=A0AAN7BEN7_9PEZI|nr:hypothetical protein QBC38DRAFT_540266 [Podospora fimiseda]
MHVCCPLKSRAKEWMLTITHYRQSQHTHDAFIKWIVEEHLPVALSIFKKHGVLEYALFVTPSALNEALQQEMGKFRPTLDFADFDCIIEYMIPEAQTVNKVMSDPDWPALVSLEYSTPYLLKTGETVNLKKE